MRAAHAGPLAAFSAVALLCASLVVSSLDGAESEPDRAPVAVPPTSPPVPTVASSPFSARHTDGRASVPQPSASQDESPAPTLPAPTLPAAERAPRTGPVVITVPGPRGDKRPSLVVPGLVGDVAEPGAAPKHVEARPAPPTPSPEPSTTPTPPTPDESQSDEATPSPTPPSPSPSPEADADEGDEDEESADSTVAPSPAEGD